MNSSQMHHQSSVPHPFAFFLAKGWETTNINLLVHQEAK
jgi:hypothetical protein